MQPHHSEKSHGENIFRLAVSATIHCLIGCGIGEVLGMILSTALHLNNTITLIISILFGFIGGFGLGIVPLLRKGFKATQAFKVVFLGEGLSIFVMEMFEVGAQVLIPGLMDAHLTDLLFWTGMIVSLAVGFIAALPVNYYMIKRGVRHIH